MTCSAQPDKDRLIQFQLDRKVRKMTGMTDSLVATIERSSERAWLTLCSDHNASLGKKIVVDAVARRLRDLDLTML
jgi:hypothetical protein